MLKVNKRNGFSDRNKIDPVNTEIQLYEFDERTRIRLNNLVTDIYEEAFHGYTTYDTILQGFLRFIMDEVYVKPMGIHKVCDEQTVVSFISETIMHDKFDAVLTVVEAIGQYIDKIMTTTLGPRYIQEIGYTKVFRKFNIFFEEEYVGYRFIDEFISPISDDEEVETINDSLKNRFVAVREHISKANRLLSDREQPDYENSIKESISAVEAICQELLECNGKDASLGKMLKRLEDKGIVIHSAMKIAFDKLYGYTSDANGIRHAGDIGGPSSTFEEAKFMLVSCSAFINYLMGVSAKL